ncbi:oxidoreductase [Flavobacteriaceae bacterium S356]|uniref:Oxidoreductase n=1 Tax=Asprobacillus argus TaxID=3076534 RepID=A0ABU3LF77_9FLAO|nr:oxidoreductase [Flavobacteriaceae bacterium S356]
MKPLILLFLCAFVITSCTREYQPRNIENLEIKSIKIDSTSIRTIVAIDSNTVMFAGSNGKLGYHVEGKKTVIKTVRYKDTLTPGFRSAATNGSDFFILSVSNPALLYKTSIVAHELVYKEEHEKVFYDSMKFFNELDGIAMGDPTDDCLSVLLTNDGGKTWNKISCDNLPKIVAGEAAFAASNTNIKVLGDTVWIVTGGAKARVFKSTDKGLSWNVYDTPIVQGDGPQGIYSVDFADELHGIIIGGDYLKSEANERNKAITVDGGVTWITVADGQEPTYKSCVQYVPNTEGKEVFAVGKTGISYSKDGGKNWNKISEEAFYTIQFVDRTAAWLSGNGKLGKLVLPHE